MRIKMGDGLRVYNATKKKIIVVVHGDKVQEKHLGLAFTFRVGPDGLQAQIERESITQYEALPGGFVNLDAKKGIIFGNKNPFLSIYIPSDDGKNVEMVCENYCPPMDKPVIAVSSGCTELGKSKKKYWISEDGTNYKKK